jgi:MtN3 and saliva related transmembrane protein
MFLSSLAAVLAPLFTCIQLMPQLYKTYVTKSVQDLSLESLLVITMGNLLWLVHGYYIRDMSLVFAGIVATIINLSLLALYRIYRR